MEIAFRTKALRTVCLSGSAMDERFGAEGAELLRRCIADMRAAISLRDVPLAGPRLVEGASGNEVSIDIGKGLSIVLRANHAKPPKVRDGSVDWARVERVLVQRVERASR